MVKRSFDIVCSTVGIFLLAPFLMAIAILIKLDSPGPVFFRQVRIGQFGKPFRIFKFRTMCQGAENKGALISTSDDSRITGIGMFLRKYKIDELPQLFNVIAGEMSLVGPRPEVSKFVELFKEGFEEILKAKPGITDYASLQFKDENELLKAADNPEKKYIEDILPLKIEYCKMYLRDQNIFTDIRLIFLTLAAIFRK